MSAHDPPPPSIASTGGDNILYRLSVNSCTMLMVVANGAVYEYDKITKGTRLVQRADDQARIVFGSPAIRDGHPQQQQQGRRPGPGPTHVQWVVAPGSASPPRAATLLELISLAFILDKALQADGLDDACFFVPRHLAPGAFREAAASILAGFTISAYAADMPCDTVTISFDSAAGLRCVDSSGRARQPAACELPWICAGRRRAALLTDFRALLQLLTRSLRNELLGDLPWPQRVTLLMWTRRQVQLKLEQTVAILAVSDVDSLDLQTYLEHHHFSNETLEQRLRGAMSRIGRRLTLREGGDDVLAWFFMEAAVMVPGRARQGRDAPDVEARLRRLYGAEAACMAAIGAECASALMGWWPAAPSPDAIVQRD